MKKFALIGAGGYISPRHLKAIKETGNVLVAALDNNDSVGVLDSYFPETHFFTEFERFDRHLEKLRRQNGDSVDFVTICSPNYLHDAHIRFALRIKANAICEKPLVLNPWNLEALKAIEAEDGRKINSILQLRLHPNVIALKEKIDNCPLGRIHDINLTYITPRGKWYQASWKGDLSKSGGIATNIGIHFFDMLTWVFGPVKDNIVHIKEHNKSAGFLELEKARVRWFLSLDWDDFPFTQKLDNLAAYRSIEVDGEEIDFSKGFTDLHTESYKKILSGEGFGIDEVKSSLEIVTGIRNAKPIGIKGSYHQYLHKAKKNA